MGVMEHRLNLMDVRIVEVPLGIGDLKTHLDGSHKALSDRFDCVEAQMHELIRLHGPLGARLDAFEERLSELIAL